MKTRNIILLALTALLTVSCHSWDDPAENAGIDSYGNKYLQESAEAYTSISDLTSKYKSDISSGTIKQITKATQIKVIVTGNDEGSNIYKMLYVVDATGGLCIKIDKSSIFTEAAVGQCLLIDLQGLYIGGDGKQPKVGGTPYEYNGKTQIGNLSRNTWAEHFKLIPAIEGLSAKPITTNDMTAFDMDKDYGKVVTLVGITMEDADGKAVFATSGTVNQKIAGQLSTVYVRTSSYAKYAKMVMPTEKFNITGVISRYNSEWQIMPRTLDDIQKYTGTEKYDRFVDIDPTPVEPAGSGTAADPYNVARALEKAKALPKVDDSKATLDASNSLVDAVVKGYVKTIDIDTGYGNATYYICDKMNGVDLLEVYRGKSLNGEKFTKADEVKPGDLVVVQGTIFNFKGTLEFTSGSKILSITKAE